MAGKLGRSGRKRYPEEHGTFRGYNQHRDWGRLPVCMPCADAWNEWQRNYQKERRRRAENEQA